MSSMNLTKVIQREIRKETKATEIKLKGIYEDEDIVTGFFETDTGKEGSFSYGKNSWTSVVNVY